MKILTINKYLYPKGGDARVALRTAGLLKSNGHEALLWGMKDPRNPEYPEEDSFIENIDYSGNRGPREIISAAATMIYSLDAKRRLEGLLDRQKPDVVHLHNFAHQISPSILDAICARGIPSVMTMHDYKLVCPAYVLTLNGRICTMCSDGRYYNCLKNRCTKGSFMKSLLNTAEMYFHHDILDIYEKIHTFIAPSRFMAAKLREMGFGKKIEHVSNCIDTSDYADTSGMVGSYMLYFGRLSREKGVHTLLDAVRGVTTALKMVGDGPERSMLTEKVRKDGLNVGLPGHKSGSRLREEIYGAVFTILPSECAENNPLSVMESFAAGKAVIAADIGGIPELVKHGERGLLFKPGNAEDLRNKILSLLNDREMAARMGRNAREYAKKELSPELYYTKLMNIYQQARGE